jgi:prophage antirepressor-like protein
MESKSLSLQKSFEGMDVEIIQGENGEPLFELYSTGAALGYSRWTESKGKQYFKIEKTRIDTVMKNGSITGLAHNGQTYLTEEILYDFMLEAKTAKCKSFRKWVTSEVLPSIRNTGGYVAPNIAGTDGYILDLAKSMQLTNQVVNGMLGAITRIETFVQDSIQSKDLQIEETRELIGLRDRNTKVLCNTLKDKLSDLYGTEIAATNPKYKSVRDKIFKENRVYKWEDIPVGDFNKVHSYIDSLDLSQII